MDSHTLIQALIYLGSAALIVPIAVRLGLGSVLGYLIAGCIIGPWGLRLVTDAESILHFAEIGVVLMLFVIGLELDSPAAMETARFSVWRRRATDGGLRRPDWSVLYVPRSALAGGGTDWYDAGALLHGDSYAGDE
ncbi:glutathione-regulated potassium-efflux system protein [Citrobacter amalonaticus]|nr:glutathione-regulated potassium-efflux system protein [Citrobacter amalonaticus]